MRSLDRLLQAWRAGVARRWVPVGARILDIGCHQGEFLRSLGERIGPSVGFDPLAPTGANGRLRLLAEPFRPPTAFPDGAFDAVVMLATLEHIRDKEPLARECFRLLGPGGRVVVTVPAPWVDSIVDLLCRLKLADGMSLDEHHGYDPAQTPALFIAEGFVLERRKRFQLGANHLLVFRKPAAAPLACPAPFVPVPTTASVYA